VVHLFKQVRLVRRDPLIRTRGTSRRNGALVAVQTAIVTHLEKQRAVTESIAPLDAFAAAVTEFFIDGVLVVGILHKGPLYGSERTELIFGARIQFLRFRLKVAGAEVAVSANSVGMNAFDGGFLQYAVSGAVAALNTYARIDLPDRIAPFAFSAQETG
jgi:hypothetical protein